MQDIQAQEYSKPKNVFAAMHPMQCTLWEWLGKLGGVEKQKLENFSAQSEEKDKEKVLCSSH